MRPRQVIFLSLLLSSSIAFAQDNTTPPAPPTPAPAEPEPVADSTHPVGMAFGIGAGWTFSQDLLTPNTVSARFRCASGLTFEPVVVLQVEHDTQNPGGGASDVSATTTNLAIGTNLRYPFATRGRMDLVGVAGVAFAFNLTNPDGDTNNVSTINIGLDYGLSVEYWIRRWWSISATATNPFLSYSHTSQEQVGGDASQSSFTVGAVWNPTVNLLLHLYF